MIENLTWRVVLLSVVFVTDLVMVIGLVREELRDWRLNRSASGAGSLLKLRGIFRSPAMGEPKGRGSRARTVGVLVVALSLAMSVGTNIGRAAQPSAADTVHRFYDTLLSTMQNGHSLGERGRFDRLAPIITSSFDVGYMAQKAVGPTWFKLSPPQQQQVTQAFQRYVTATYADRFDNYSGEKFQVGAEQSTSFGTIVQSRIVKSDGELVSINYLMHQNGDLWQVADIYLTGTISELATLRSQFTSVLAREGVDGLIATLNRKTDMIVTSNLP